MLLLFYPSNVQQVYQLHETNRKEDSAVNYFITDKAGTDIYYAGYYLRQMNFRKQKSSSVIVRGGF